MSKGKMFQGSVQFMVIQENGLSIYMKSYWSEGTKILEQFKFKSWSVQTEV